MALNPLMHDDPPLVGQGPRAPVKQEVHQRVEGHAVGDGVVAIEGMPVDMGSFDSEVVAAQSCPVAYHGAAVLVRSPSRFGHPLS